MASGLISSVDRFEKFLRWEVIGLEAYFRRKTDAGKLDPREEPVRDANCSGKGADD